LHFALGEPGFASLALLAAFLRFTVTPAVAVQAAKYVSSRAHSVLFFLVLVHVSYWVKVQPNRSYNIMTSQNQRTVDFYLTFREVLDISRAVRLVRTSDAAKN